MNHAMLGIERACGVVLAGDGLGHFLSGLGGGGHGGLGGRGGRCRLFSGGLRFGGGGFGAAGRAAADEKRRDHKNGCPE